MPFEFLDLMVLECVILLNLKDSTLKTDFTVDDVILRRFPLSLVSIVRRWCRPSTCQYISPFLFDCSLCSWEAIIRDLLKIFADFFFRFLMIDIALLAQHISCSCGRFYACELLIEII